MTTKLCSECRHSMTSKISFLPMLCQYHDNGMNKIFMCAEERQNESGCGQEAKHYEPIGGADNE